MLQVFNFINARKLNDELNVFEGLDRSKPFVIIVFLIIIIQFLLLTFGHAALNVVTWGLQPIGWLVSIGIGATGLISSFILKLLPLEKLCSRMGEDTVRLTFVGLTGLLDEEGPELKQIFE